MQKLKGLSHPACLASAVSWFAFVVAIFMGNGNKQRLVKGRHAQGMLDATDPLKFPDSQQQFPKIIPGVLQSRTTTAFAQRSLRFKISNDNDSVFCYLPGNK